jgi:hypothetical protein
MKRTENKNLEGRSFTWLTNIGEVSSAPTTSIDVPLFENVTYEDIEVTKDRFMRLRSAIILFRKYCRGVSLGDFSGATYEAVGQGFQSSRVSVTNVQLSNLTRAVNVLEAALSYAKRSGDNRLITLAARDVAVLVDARVFVQSILDRVEFSLAEKTSASVFGTAVHEIAMAVFGLEVG